MQYSVSWDGHKQNPSWCLAVKMTPFIPACTKVFTHCSQSSLVGLKVMGSVSPYPHYRSLKVLSPKTTKAYVSIFCQSTCFCCGTGRIGWGAWTDGWQDASIAVNTPVMNRFVCFIELQWDFTKSKYKSFVCLGSKDKILFLQNSNKKRYLAEKSNPPSPTSCWSMWMVIPRL